MDTIKKVASRYLAASRLLKVGPGQENQKLTDAMVASKLKARSAGDFVGAMLQAGFYAKKTGKDMYVYAGNSYMVAVWRASYKASDYLDPINNTGDRIFLVKPDLTVIQFWIQRP